MFLFRSLHPITQFIWFASVIGITMFFIHPVFLAVSLAMSWVYVFLLSGISGLLKNFKITFSAGILIIIINSLVSHNGITVLCFLPDGNALTAESVIFGCAAAMLMSASVMWFSCSAGIFTTEKVIYLFGRISPRLALLISMTLRFFSKLPERFSAVHAASGVLYRNNVRQRLRRGMKELSSLIQWALESSADTADSMSSRGYGNGKRTFYSDYEFRKTDLFMISAFIALDIVIITGCISGWADYSYYPFFDIGIISVNTAVMFTSFVLLCFLPAISEIWEALMWKYSE